MNETNDKKNLIKEHISEEECRYISKGELYDCCNRSRCNVLF